MSSSNISNTAKPSNGKVQWLTFLVYLLLAFLTALTGWQQIQVTRLETRVNILPKEYVQLERYLCDKANLTEQLKSINAKLDRLIEREMKK